MQKSTFLEVQAIRILYFKGKLSLFQSKNSLYSKVKFQKTIHEKHNTLSHNITHS